jgi:dipeptide transport system permease protein
MFITVLPNCMAPLIVQATLGFSTAILDAAALGFLGWARSRRRRNGAPCWPTAANSCSAPLGRDLPGPAILITVLAINLMGDGLRDALDPKLKR